ncbi:MAG TPA: Gfo/Idh/MocA family oxidoreductase [Candidatus Limnocylindrales bacterium]
MSGRLSIALVGAGRIGSLHASVLARSAGVAELIVVDDDQQRAREIADTVGASVAGTVESALDRADAAVIAAPTDVHADLIRKSIRRGLPTFCEKPLAQDLATTLDVAAEIEGAAVPFQLGFQRRFDAAYAEARRLVETGGLGTLYSITLTAHDHEPPPESYIPGSGGLFRDSSIHDFDILRWMTGDEVAEVGALGAVLGFPMFARYDDIDTTVATIRMTRGTLVALTGSRHNPMSYDIRAELFGSSDTVTVGLGPRTAIRSLEPGASPPTEPGWPGFIERFRDAYAAELDAFVRVATGELGSPCTAHDGVEALRIAEAATRSLQEHRPVSLDEIPAAQEPAVPQEEVPR